MMDLDLTCSDRYDLVTLFVRVMTAAHTIWFRPIAFAVVVLGYVQEIFARTGSSWWQNIVADAKRLQAEIQEGIENYAYTTNSKGWKILRLEVDGLGMLVLWMTQMYQVCWLRLIWLLRHWRWGLPSNSSDHSEPLKIHTSTRRIR